MKDNKKYIDRDNALRYMGCRGEVPDSLSAIISECERELCRVMTPRCIYSVNNKSDLSGVLAGNDVNEHLEGCDRVIVFAATLGSAVDALINKYQAVDLTRALVIDAEASAAVESFCNETEREFAKLGIGHMTWRYSPGYGDYPLEVQTDLLDLIDAGRKIGLYAGESCMLNPVKSVTAVIGVSDDPVIKAKSSCATCAKYGNCSYRKEDKRCGY